MGPNEDRRAWSLVLQDVSTFRLQFKLDADEFCLFRQVWNLSQNVDHSTSGSSKPGICPCLTPSMIHYITNHGGPMVGLEALSMQGLPVNGLLLTREAEDQLADLAGNATSTTVVGACILAALVIGKPLLKEGSDRRTYEQHHMDDDEPKAEDGDGLWKSTHLRTTSRRTSVPLCPPPPPPRPRPLTPWSFTPFCLVLTPALVHARLPKALPAVRACWPTSSAASLVAKRGRGAYLWL